MKAVVVNHPGDRNVLEVTERPIPQIKEGWSLVKIEAFGINRSEIFTRNGYSPSVSFPRILGIECVGSIVETSNEAVLPVGHKVISIMGEMGRDFDGSYAEYVLLPNNQIYPIQTKLSWENLAAVPETYFTAFGSMKQLRIEKNDTILVRGAASGVGIAFTKLVKATYSQVRIIGSVRHLEKADRLMAFGYDDIILEKDGELKTDLIFDKVLELVGPSVIKNSISHMAMNGIICNTGLLGGQWYLEKFDPTFDLQKNIYLTTFYSGNVSKDALQALLNYIEKSDIDVRPERMFTLDCISEAHAYVESSEAIGKVVVRNEV
ncbi:zinc-binding dehydrogenase [Streptococcus pneumoniae]|nr:zinc-binding dehydrogenase [Streptococcus pneumoniae]